MNNLSLPKAFINTRIPEIQIETQKLPFVETILSINDLDLDKIFKCGIIIGFVFNTYLFLLKSIKLYNKQVAKKELINGYFTKIEYGYILLLILLLCVII
jgi:hypothetical protein